mgnify:CR=1 FL=1
MYAVLYQLLWVGVLNEIEELEYKGWVAVG